MLFIVYFLSFALSTSLLSRAARKHSRRSVSTSRQQRPLTIKVIGNDDQGVPYLKIIDYDMLTRMGSYRQHLSGSVAEIHPSGEIEINGSKYFCRPNDTVIIMDEAVMVKPENGPIKKIFDE